MDHLSLGWRLAALGGGPGRFQHLFLPDDPDEAHQALAGLSRRAVRRQGAAAGEYDQARLHDLVANEGFSHHPVHGAAPSHGWMASYDAPEGSGIAAVHHISAITPQHIADHREAAAAHLSQPSSYQGGWHDTATGDVYLDASKHHEDKDSAMNFAAGQQQKAVFHLGDFTEHFLHPHQDPIAQKDLGAWHERYGANPQPHPGFAAYAHRYPFTDEQKSFWHGEGHHVGVKGRYDGRPIGAFRSERYVERELVRRSGSLD